MGSFSASVKGFEMKSIAAMREIMRQATQEVVSRAQQDQISLARGATSVIPGKIPVDIGFLRNSLASGLNGAFGSPMANSYELVINGMQIGDVANFAWTAEYAYQIEVGWGTYPGAHFVGANAANWQSIVDFFAARYRV